MILINAYQVHQTSNSGNNFIVANDVQQKPL